MSDVQKRVLVVAPSSEDRTELAAALLDFGMDVVLADDAGRAIRKLGEGVDVLIIHRDERKLACESLARLAASKKADLRLFALGRDAPWKTQPEASALPSIGSEAAAELAKQLGLGVAAPAGPTLTAESLLWSSPRSSVQIVLARKGGTEQVAYLRTQCDWADAWRDAFVNALKRAKTIGCAVLDLAWIDDTGVHAIGALRQGRSLASQLAGQTMSLAEALPIMRTLAATLEKMHGAPEPLLSGPITAGQIWIDANGPHFLYPGATRIAYNYDRSLRGRLHQPMAVHSSAEELAGNGSTGATDVFYMASLLYELLTGSEPYPKQAVASFQEAVRNGRFRELQLYVPALDANVANVIHAALSPRAEQRPALEEFARALARG